jgi:hypothetical protein
MDNKLTPEDMRLRYEPFIEDWFRENEEDES